MPTVPGRSPVEESRESILGSRGIGWPIGQQRTLSEEIWRQTAKAQDPVEAGGLLRIKPKAWEKFITESPKAKNIEERTTRAPELRPAEKEFYKQYTQQLDEAYMKKPQVEPTSPMRQALGQGSMKGIATKEMGLNEQEQFLYQHHLDNLAKGGVPSAGGTKTSTLLAVTADVDDKVAVIPTIWDNKVVSGDQAVKNAEAAGLDKFPSYNSREEALDRYSQMHDYMDKDTQ
jgi:hypothetical protein